MWKQIHRDDKVNEFFISGEFIQSQKWESIPYANPSDGQIMKKYKYLKDYVTYDGSKYYPHIQNCLKFSEITHATDMNTQVAIQENEGFKPGKKVIPDFNIDRFVWFGVKICEPEMDSLKKQYAMQCLLETHQISNRTKEHLAHVDVQSLVNSPCFQPVSRYGECKFTFKIQEVTDEYMLQFCPRNEQADGYLEPEFRMLGTFAYKMEIMHTVLVCPPGTPNTDQYPQLFDGQNQTPVICKDPNNLGTFIWSPDSTGDRHNVAENMKECVPFRRWEHVTFAFYIPQDRILKLKNLWDHLSLCIYANPKKRFQKSSINYTITNFLDKIQKKSLPKFKKCLINRLICLVRGYLDEEELYKKMNILYMYEPVDLEKMKYRVDELLDGEEFDWSPLLEWMNAVQQTKNKAVLCSISNYLSKKLEMCTKKLQILTKTA